MTKAKSTNFGGTEDFDIWRGTDWEQLLRIKNHDRTPKDILNWTFELEVLEDERLEPEEDIDDPLFKMEFPSQISIESASDGLILLKLSELETSKLPFEVGYYRLEATTDNDKNRHLLSGKLDVK